MDESETWEAWEPRLACSDGAQILGVARDRWDLQIPKVLVWDGPHGGPHNFFSSFHFSQKFMWSLHSKVRESRRRQRRKRISQTLMAGHHQTLLSLISSFLQIPLFLLSPCPAARSPDVLVPNSILPYSTHLLYHLHLSRMYFIFSLFLYCQHSTPCKNARPNWHLMKWPSNQCGTLALDNPIMSPCHVWPISGA